jgi:hypothetical protein
MTDITFPFRFHPAFRLPARLFGVRSETAWVTLDPEHLTARFGPWTIRTELANVASAGVTGGYAWPKVIGPAHVSLVDRGLTFATNPDEGVCIEFVQPVTGLEPVGVIRHPALTVTVENPQGLAGLLDRSSRDRFRSHSVDQDVTTEVLVREVSDDLGALTASELRDRARELGVSGVSRMSKADLVGALGPPLES